MSYMLTVAFDHRGQPAVWSRLCDSLESAESALVEFRLLHPLCYRDHTITPAVREAA